MPTINAIIRYDDIRKDKTWNVKIRIGHKGKEAFIKTIHFVEKWQLDKAHNIKDKAVLDLLRPIELRYTSVLNAMHDIEEISTSEIKARLMKHDRDFKDPSFSADKIDILAFGWRYVADKLKAGKGTSITGIKTVLYSLRDYFQSDSVDIKEINFMFLTAYEKYLRAERAVKREYRKGLSREIVLSGINDAGLHNHMRDLRLLFNEARSYYNDEDTGTIKIFHYPFKKYKVGSAPLTEHRNRTIEEIRKIRDLKAITTEQAVLLKESGDNNTKFIIEGSRAELARDLFMLSFYLVGMNAADLYELPIKFGDRINYNRAKTRSRRKDKAFISVKVIDEARPLLEKYAGKLQKRYTSKAGLNAAIDKGLAIVSEASGVTNIDFYDARHTIGSEARNTCGFSFEDVQIALNQKERTVTDIYVAPDWSTVDRVQGAVAGLL
jgi:hypothetical protein